MASIIVSTEPRRFSTTGGRLVYIPAKPHIIDGKQHGARKGAGDRRIGCARTKGHWPSGNARRQHQSASELSNREAIVATGTDFLEKSAAAAALDAALIRIYRETGAHQCGTRTTFTCGRATAQIRPHPKPQRRRIRHHHLPDSA
jgi:hypothetical protein